MSTIKKTATRKKTPQKKTTKSAARKSKSSQNMSDWMKYAISVVMVVVFSLGFYWFFIRPYAYRWKPCYGQKWYGVCMPGKFNIHGVDISHYQGNIDWEKLVQNKLVDFPLHFIFLKATEGGDHGDDTFAENFRKAREHGFVRGAYHFFIPQTDPIKQADFFIRTVKLKEGDLPPVLDVEMRGKKSPEELQAAVKVWLRRIESHYGVKPILYTSYKFKKRYLNDSAFNSYPYWIAHYYVDSVRYQGSWHFWQHTDVGTVPGIEKEVDLNVFNGTLEDLRSLTIQKKDSLK